MWWEDDHERQVGKDLDGGNCGLVQGTVLTFTWKDWEKAQITTWDIKCVLEWRIQKTYKRNGNRFTSCLPNILVMLRGN